jgi:hypothetical protein
LIEETSMDRMLRHRLAAARVPSVLGGIVLAACLIGSTALPAGAGGEATGGQPGSWLMNYSGARTLGMGGAFVATADDAFGILWNPAGLQRMDQNELMFENVRLFEDAAVNGFAFAVPGSRLPSFGISMVALRSGGFERTDEMNGDLGTFQERETAYLLTMAKGLTPRLAIGANLKVVQQSVEDWSAGGLGGDVGAIVQVTPALRLGASASNLGGPRVTLRDTPESFPLRLRGGAALELLGGRGMVAAEVDQTTGAGIGLHAGAEYWIQRAVALRVGLQDERTSGGFSYRVAPQYQVDYAVADHPLGLTHRVGIAYRFGGFFASSRAEPEMFSPTGEKPTTKISLNAHTKVAAESWTLDVVAKSNEVVRRFSGPGLPPPHIQWDGKDESGLPVADGTYSYRLVVRDTNGRMLDSPARRVTIATGGPQGDVPVITNP